MLEPRIGGSTFEFGGRCMSYTLGVLKSRIGGFYLLASVLGSFAKEAHGNWAQKAPLGASNRRDFLNRPRVWPVYLL